MIDLYSEYKLAFWLASFAVPLTLCVWHYLVFARKVGEESSNGLIRRFNGMEMVTHWLRIIFLTILVYSGVALVLGQYGHINYIHGFTGIFLTLVTIFNLFWWFKDSLFRSYDLVWLRNMGGYLSREPVELPAGRFNAGQKIFYWSSTLLVIALFISAMVLDHAQHAGDIMAISARSVHGLLACFMTAMIIGHAYLSLLVNPPTARVLLDGKCSCSYVEKHHALWDFKTND